MTRFEKFLASEGGLYVVLAVCLVLLALAGGAD